MQKPKLYICGEMSFTIPDAGDAPAIVEDLPIEQYHALGNIKAHGKNAVFSKSMLVHMDCPARFKWLYIDGGIELEQEKDHLNIGAAVHTHALEPKIFDDCYYIIGEGIKRDKRTAAYQAEIEKAAGRTMLTAAQFELVKGMSKSIVGNRKAIKLLEGTGKIEASIFWKDPITGLNMRCRPDWMRDDGLLVNIKTAASLEPRKFSKSAFDLHYDMSAAIECAGYKELTGKDPDNYVFLGVESKPPYIVEAYDSFRPWDLNDLSKTTYYDTGFFRYRRALDRLAQCLKTNLWPGYNDIILPMSVPGYAMKNLEGENE